MAVKRRCPDPGLLHHSDQGCTYASEDYRTRLEQHGITCSMSRRGNCDDNAVIESWFSTVKSEEGDRLESYAHAKEPCSITSRCSISSDADTRRSARSVRPNSNDAQTKRARILWKTAHDAVSHRLHARTFFRKKRKKNDGNDVVNPSTESDQAHGPVHCRMFRHVPMQDTSAPTQSTTTRRSHGMRLRRQGNRWPAPIVRSADMTDEMLALACEDQRKSGLTNDEFLLHLRLRRINCVLHNTRQEG
jgi:hypothetical protein